MEHEVGTVIKTENDRIYIKMETSEQCHSCGAKDCCVFIDEENTRLLELSTSEAIETGDRVTIGYEPRSRIISAFLVFIVPLLFLIAGYFIGNAWFDREGIAILTAFSMFIISFFIVRILGKILERQQSFNPVIVDVQSV